MMGQMKENPYRTPISQNEGDDRREEMPNQRLRETRKTHRRWSQRCWVFGIIAVVVGISGLNLSQYLLVSRKTDELDGMIVSVALCVLAIGCGLLLFGSISFWVRNGR